MADEPMFRLMGYHRRRYRLANGWSIRFRIISTLASTGRPHGIKYAFTLHDTDGLRLLGFDNAHGIPRAETYDHRHPFRRLTDLKAYEFRSADDLICDFFAAVERACRQEGVPFEVDAEEIELEAEDESEPEEPR